MNRLQHFCNTYSLTITVIAQKDYSNSQKKHQTRGRDLFGTQKIIRIRPLAAKNGEFKNNEIFNNSVTYWSHIVTDSHCHCAKNTTLV